MVFFDGNSHLDYLYRKSLRYQHHRENYVTYIYTKTFKNQETSRIWSCDRSLRKSMEFHLIRYRKKIGSIIIKGIRKCYCKIDTEIEIEFQKGGELSQEVKREELKQRNVQLKNHLQHRRVKNGIKSKKSCIKKIKLKKILLVHLNKKKKQLEMKIRKIIKLLIYWKYLGKTILLWLMNL